MNKPKHIAFTARGSFMGIAAVSNSWCPSVPPTAALSLR
jgi:hypothetical protein